MFRHIYWPMLRPLTTVVVGLAIVGSLKTFDVVWAMTKGGPGKQSETLALRMWKSTFQENQWGMGGAIAVFLTVITVLAAGLYLRRQLSESTVGGLSAWNRSPSAGSSAGSCWSPWGCSG